MNDPRDAINDENYRKLYADQNPVIRTYLPKPTIAGIISQDTYDWAIRQVQVFTSDMPSQMILNSMPFIEHARWIIDRVHDGTLEIAHD